MRGVICPLSRRAEQVPQASCHPVLLALTLRRAPSRVTAPNSHAWRRLGHAVGPRRGGAGSRRTEAGIAVRAYRPARRPAPASTAANLHRVVADGLRTAPHRPRQGLGLMGHRRHLLAPCPAAPRSTPRSAAPSAGSRVSAGTGSCGSVEQFLTAALPMVAWCRRSRLRSRRRCTMHAVRPGRGSSTAMLSAAARDRAPPRTPAIPARRRGPRRTPGALSERRFLRAQHERGDHQPSPRDHDDHIGASPRPHRCIVPQPDSVACMRSER